MNICDFAGSYEVSNVRTLTALLKERYEHNANHFWMSHQADGKPPQLALAVKDALAYLHYFPRESDPGFSSRGSLARTLEGEMTTFFLGAPVCGEPRVVEKIQVTNDSIVSFAAALEAAREFFRTAQRPRCVKWRRL